MRIPLSNAFTLLCLLVLSGCDSKKPPVESPPPVFKPEVQPNLAPLGRAPDWNLLRPYEGIISRTEFERLLNNVYALPGSTQTTLALTDDSARICKQSSLPLTDPNNTLDLRFGSGPKPRLRYWRTRSEIPPPPDPTRPLAGVRIALDPGHLGGKWAELEERLFQPETGPPVCEGNLTLLTAQVLKPMLKSLGATVSMVRSQNEPVTTERPEDFISQAREELERMGLDPDHPGDENPAHTVRWQAEKLFYRTAEIRARARLVNDSLRPDLVVCLHFNASDWGKPGAPLYSPDNHLHLLLNGAFSLDELTHDDERYEMLSHLLSGVHEEELGLARLVADSLAKTTGLRPFTYRGGAMAVAGQPYLWIRNLLANRLYQCPVVYCEPFLMNNRDTAARLQAGDYEGEREINGTASPSIFRQYAEGVAQGLERYYSVRP